MFYINRNLKTELTFSHYDMDKLASDEEILKKLREKVEGRCHPEYGYLIQISKTQNIDISVPHVETNGCVVIVTFSAITFKRKKPPTQPRRTTSSTSSSARFLRSSSRGRSGTRR
jgi:DNA-directed RNA polymerase subunit E'/Rpb7